MATFDAKRRDSEVIARLALKWERCLWFPLGDINSTHKLDHRADMSRLELVPQLDAVAQHFDRRLQGYLEIGHQGELVNRRSMGFLLC